MAYDAWGGSWASSWALHWTGEHTSVPVPQVDTSNAGPGGRLFSGKRKNKVIRFSDFESREAYAQALQAAIPMSQVKPIETIERTVDDDDDDVVFMIMRMLH